MNILDKTVTIIACHSENEIKTRSVINNIDYLSKITNIIYIVNSNQFKGLIENIIDDEKFIINDILSKRQIETYIKDNNLRGMSLKEASDHWNNYGKFKQGKINELPKIFFEYQENTHLLCQMKWFKSIKKLSKDNNYILTNDSFFITRELNDFKEKIFHNYEMLGLVDSNQFRYHYQDFLKFFNSDGIKKLLNFYQKNFNEAKTKDDVINLLEINSTYITSDKNCLYRVPDNFYGNINFDTEVYEKYINYYNYPIIKIKNTVKINKYLESISGNNSKRNFEKYKNVFSKYYLSLKNPYEDIDYSIETEKLVYNKKICSIHCHNLSNLYNYFGDIILKLKNYHFIITFNETNKKLENFGDDFNSLTLIKLKNIGFDIANKFVTISYLLENVKIDFKYVLFLHSKSDSKDRNNYIEPFLNNVKYLESIIDNGIDMIIPNYHNICAKNNPHVINGVETELSELYEYFNISKNINEIEFNGTNTMVLSYKYCRSLEPYLKVLFNHLNYENDFDNQWYKLAYNKVGTKIEDNYKEFLIEKKIGNCLYSKKNNLKILDNNGSYEHLFERFWIEYCKSLNLNYFCMPKNILDYYNIKLYPIYFPQFHNSKENNEIWGDGFTEWTLLKPYPESIILDKRKINIYKPSNDIGFYSLDSANTIHKQIDIAKKYGINGFMIYHYWFGNNRRALKKVEDHILEGNFDFPFYFCWANEPWTQQWEGGGDDKCFIEQNYEKNDNLDHINYLIKFFKLKNYVKNKQGECLFYIYNFKHIKNSFKIIKDKWEKVLEKHNIKIKIITTSNAEPYNQINGTEDKHIFSPASATKYWEKRDKKIAYGVKKGSEKISRFKKIYWYLECDYLNLIKYYNELDFKNHHICIPLFWNNIIRKKKKPHLQLKNFDTGNFETMIKLVITKILLRNKNKIVFKDIEKYNIKGKNNDSDLFLDNIVTVNAWNEWNEQAILEPNNVTGYENLEIISKYFNNK